MRKPLAPKRPLVTVSLGELDYVQQIREEGHTLGYETLSQYLRALIIEGRKVLAPKPKARKKSARS